MYCDACGFEHQGESLSDCPRCDGQGMPGALVQIPLPAKCFSKRKRKNTSGAIIHFVSAVSASESRPYGLDFLLPILKNYKVSYHFYITRQGTVIGLIPEDAIGYHAGRSRMNGVDRCNNFTIGIALAGMTGVPYESVQIEVLKNFLTDFMVKYNFNTEWIQGHDKVRRDWNIEYPEKKGAKKYDPGHLFPWDDVLGDLRDIVK